MPEKLQIVFLGLSITSSWGNGHATTYRGLIRELAKNGHDVWFLERDVPWYAEQRDLPDPEYCRTRLYSDRAELEDIYRPLVRDADAVIVGSYVPEGVDVGYWVTRVAEGVTAFYDIDTPVTLAKLERGDFEYLSPDLIPRYSLYLSFTGGPTLDVLETRFGSPAARALYCSFDPDLYFPEAKKVRYDLGYMGTYSDDRQPTVECLLNATARKYRKGKFAVVGPKYPGDIQWAKNVERIDHLSPSKHRDFYNSQRFTLNVTRSDMIAAGYSPSVRLFEAAACGTPIISDYWKGIDSIFEPGEEILIAHNTDQCLHYLTSISDEKRKDIGEQARRRVLREHTAGHRAQALEDYLFERMESRALLRGQAVVL